MLRRILQDPVAIDAPEDRGVLRFDQELGLHWLLEVGDAAGVAAMRDPLDHVGERHGELLRHVEVADDVDGGPGGDEGSTFTTSLKTFLLEGTCMSTLTGDWTLVPSTPMMRSTFNAMPHSM
jgi:hypothetical protein